MKGMKYLLRYLSYWLPFMIIFNVGCYIFGLFYNLDFNAIHWSPGQRGFVGTMNVVIMFLVFLGFLGIVVRAHEGEQK